MYLKHEKDTFGILNYDKATEIDAYIFLAGILWDVVLHLLVSHRVGVGKQYVGKKYRKNPAVPIRKPGIECFNCLLSIKLLDCIIKLENA